MFPFCDLRVFYLLRVLIFCLNLLPDESQVVLLEKNPESKESLEDNSAKNFDLCRQFFSLLTSRFDAVFGVSGNMRRLTRSNGLVGLFGGDETVGGLSDSLDRIDCDERLTGGDALCDDIEELE